MDGNSVSRIFIYTCAVHRLVFGLFRFKLCRGCQFCSCRLATSWEVWSGAVSVISQNCCSVSWGASLCISQGYNLSLFLGKKENKLLELGYKLANMKNLPLINIIWTIINSSMLFIFPDTGVDYEKLKFCLLNLYIFFVLDWLCITITLNDFSGV